MRYEVERRVLFSDKSEFDRVRKFLEENGKFLGKKEMKSYLFREPTRLRIRLIKGKDKILITEKRGEYQDKALEEDEKEIGVSGLNSFVEEIKGRGYKKCSMVHTERHSYEFDGLRVELNKIDYLGLIAEVEGLTENKDEISELEKRIKEVMKKLDVKELDPNEYQGMMEDMYAQTLKGIENYEFSF